MSTLVTLVHILVCLILIGTVLLQEGKGGGMGGAFGGGNAATVFGSGGASTFLRRLTAIGATVFMFTSITLAYFASSDAGDALKSYSAQQSELKKQKKEAEDKALNGGSDASGSGSASGTASGTGSASASGAGGADVNDGDTGEEDTEARARRCRSR